MFFFLRIPTVGDCAFCTEQSEFAGSSLNDDIGPSSSGSAETGYDVRSFNRGM